MDALILSCSTGGGHNAAGEALKEELIDRGHHVEMFDPYSLISSRLASGIGNVYIKLVQKSPKLFGFVYRLGEVYRRLPFRSPVYFINKKLAEVLKRYLQMNHVDVILMPHLFPAEMITHLKKQGVSVPLSVFVATDYACIPFTEETECDYYVIPHKDLIFNFTKKGIAKEKIKPFGIPVRKPFSQKTSKEKAKELLGLNKEKNYYLIAGGSIGAGELIKVVDTVFQTVIGNDNKTELIIICGNNEKIYKKLKQKYNDHAIILHKTNKMALYMKASDLFISKPGGLSSTEAAVAGVPMLHSGPIPGCETINKRFFEKHGISIPLKHLNAYYLSAIIEKLNQETDSKEKIIPQDARQKICDWLEEVLECK